MDEKQNLVKDFEELLNGQQQEDFDIEQLFNNLFSMPDKDFDDIAPGLLENYAQTVNNAQNKLALVQMLNANGDKAEDVIELFNQISEQIREAEGISQTKKDFVIKLLALMCNAINDTEGIAKRIVRIPFEFCRDEVRVPEYAHVTDSGMDLYALDDYTIHPGETVLIPTGIKIALPPGYELQVRPKSGRALKTKLRIANTPGTIDAGYRDEIGVIIENIEAPIKDITYSFDSKGYPVITSIEHGSDMFIGKGEKFAQLVLMEVPKAALFEVSSVQDYGEDREGGFGSTGLK